MIKSDLRFHCQTCEKAVLNDCRKVPKRIAEAERKKDMLTSFKRPKWPIGDYILSVVSSFRTTNQNKINITQQK